MERKPISFKRTTTSDGQRLLFIGFFTPDEQKSGYIQSFTNQIIGYWTQIEQRRFSHVELRFSNGMVTSVTADGPVHYEQRFLSNKCYRYFFSLKISAENEDKMEKMAKNYAKNKVGFNRIGMCWNFSPITRCFPIQKRENKVFCSEYIVQLLQEGGLLKDKNPSEISVVDLFFILKDEVEEAKFDYNREYSNFKNKNPFN